MIQNQGGLWIWSSIAYETVRSKGEEKEKGMISKHCFSFLNF